MRIKILVTGLPPLHIGGTETQTYNLAKNLAKKHDVTVITRKYRGLPSEDRENGFRIKRFGFIDIPVLRFFSHIISALWQLKKLRKDTDVIYCMMLSPNGLVGALAKKIFGLKTIAAIQGGDWYYAEEKIIGRFINDFVISCSDLIVAQTDITRREVEVKYPNARMGVLPNGIDLGSKRSSGDKMVFVGNLHKRKGVDYLIRAMKDVDAGLLIVGDGEQRKYLENLADELGVGEKVEFVGRVEPRRVIKYLLKGKIFVLPTLREGLPNVIMEAMSVGLPVVSTEVAGIPEIVKDGKTGYVVRERDPEDIAKAINKLLKNESLRQEMVHNCLKEIENYSWDRIVRRFELLVTNI